MTDSIRANNTTAAGGPLFAVDNISGTTYALTKIALGVDGNDDGMVNSSNPLPITAPGVVSSYTVNTVTTVPLPMSTGGLSFVYSVSLTTAALQIKNGPAQVFGYDFTNTATSTRWLKFYDAGAVTVGSTPPNYIVGLPSMSSFSNAVTGFKTVGSFGMQFNTSCFVAATAGQASSDATAPATNEVTINVMYK